MIDRLVGSQGETRPCAGPPATVDNIDRVDVTIPAQEGTDYTFFWLDESGGMLGPGATPEADGQSEIEIDVEPTSEAAALYIKLIGQPGPDQQVINDQERVLLADLDAGQGPSDPELTARYADFLDVYAGSGDDAVAVPGSQAFEFNSIKGQAGNDTLSGNGADIGGGPG